MGAQRDELLEFSPPSLATGGSGGAMTLLAVDNLTVRYCRLNCLARHHLNIAEGESCL